MKLRTAVWPMAVLLSLSLGTLLLSPPLVQAKDPGQGQPGTNGAHGVVRPGTTPITVPRHPRIEIVFALDTTGSMGGLIAGAKNKIWSIVNEIASAKPQPEIRVGFVAYRDKGDEYVTRVHDLTSDLDAAHTTLSELKAAGGGDTPEHVNAGLQAAVKQMSWSAGGSLDKGLYQVIFLVGDCPPHMDYEDVPSYVPACEAAAERGININTIRCGGMAATEKVWLDIARLGAGDYFSLAQDGGTVSISTPYDEEMIKLGRELENTTIATRDFAPAKAASQSVYDGLAAQPAARENALNRAAFNAKSAQVYERFDVLTQINSGKRRANEIKAEELPEELAKLNPEERTKKLTEAANKQKELRQRIGALESQRSAYVREQQTKNVGKGASGLDQKLLQTVRGQANRRGFHFADPAPAGPAGSPAKP